MGGEWFTNKGAAKDPQVAFDALVERAKYDHGHAGYTGTIAEKDGFVLLTRKPLLEAEAFALMERLQDDDLGTDPTEVAIQGRAADVDPELRRRYTDDKWGPANCLPLCETAGGPAVAFLFFGWASS